MTKRHMIILAVILVALLAAFFLSPTVKRKMQSMECGNYMVSIGYAARVWAEDHDGHLPPNLVSMSNEVIETKMFICPGDHSRQPAESWKLFTPEQSSFELVAPNLQQADTNRVFMRCKIHGSILYGDGSVFVNGRLHRKF